jgi:hypothetical protein
MVGRGRDGAGRSPDEFASRLDDLKERGCAVLVVGGGSKAVHVDMCRQLLGDDDAGPRRRLQVFTDGTVAVDEHVPGGAPAEVTRIVTASTTRSTAATASQPSGGDVVELDDASLADVGVAVVGVTEAFERRYGRLGPTELRVGVDSLAPLLDVHGERAVFQFLVLATGYVRQFDGLGHCHLPVDREAYVVRLLAPLFDAVVEVRVRNGRPQQRWHLDGGDVASPWLSL